MVTERNARFWVVVGESWVKLTLRPGQSLTWAVCTSHEEGWSCERDTWTLEDGMLADVTE